ncbi:22237_t:CDS:2 [Gigaspora rosea]|nr:22237_t:CDS:2 [Gigaspora rosea]
MPQEKSTSFIKQNSKDIYPYTISNRKNNKTNYKKLYEETISQIDILEKKAQYMLKQMQEITKDLEKLERKNKKYKNLLNQELTITALWL